jgi:hypothetical protein
MSSARPVLSFGADVIPEYRRALEWGSLLPHSKACRKLASDLGFVDRGGERTKAAGRESDPPILWDG